VGDYTQQHSQYLPVAITIDNHGWDCFDEGGIPYALNKVIKPMHCHYNPQGLVKLGVQNLLQRFSL
jgi:hypothetical protein